MFVVDPYEVEAEVDAAVPPSYDEAFEIPTWYGSLVKRSRLFVRSGAMLTFQQLFRMG